MLEDFSIKRGVPSQSIPTRQISKPVSSYTVRNKMFGESKPLFNQIAQESKNKVIAFVITYGHILAILGVAGLIAIVVWITRLIG